MMAANWVSLTFVLLQLSVSLVVLPLDRAHVQGLINAAGGQVQSANVKFEKSAPFEHDPFKNGFRVLLKRNQLSEPHTSAAPVTPQSKFASVIKDLNDIM